MFCRTYTELMYKIQTNLIFQHLNFDTMVQLDLNLRTLVCEIVHGLHE